MTEKTEKAPKQNYWVKVYKLSPYLKLFPKVFELIRPYILTFATAYLFKFILTGLNIRKTKYLGQFIDLLGESRNWEDFAWFGGEALVCYILIKYVTKLHAILDARIIGFLNKEVKADLYKNVLEKDMEFFDRVRPYEAIEAINTGMEGVQNLSTRRLHGTISPLIRLFGTFTMIYRISPQLTFIVMMITPLKLMLDGHKVKTWKRSKNHLEPVQQTQEIPSYSKHHFYLMKSFSTENKELERFIDKANKCVITPQPVEKRFWDIKFVKGLAGRVLQGIVIAYGAFLILQNKITYGDLVTYNLQFVGFVTSISSTLTNFKILLKSLRQSERLFKVIEYEPKIKLHDPNGITKQVLRGDIVVKDVSFAYPTHPNNQIFSHISFEVKAGESIGIVEDNGNGKSTLANLLQRLYDPTQGEITIDGINIKDYEITWLHQHIGYVPQDPYLLDRTIEENILYGADDTQKDQIEKILRLSDAEFIFNKKRFPNGLKTMLGPEGVKLSDGEKQRIAIARALIKNPRLFIIDEPIASLDSGDENDVMKTLRKLIESKERTVIVMAKKLSNVKNCDKVYVLGEGRIMKEV